MCIAFRISRVPSSTQFEQFENLHVLYFKNKKDKTKLYYFISSPNSVKCIGTVS